MCAMCPSDFCQEKSNFERSATFGSALSLAASIRSGWKRTRVSPIVT